VLSQHKVLSLFGPEQVVRHVLCLRRLVSGHVDLQHICLVARCKMRAGGVCVSLGVLKDRAFYYEHDTSKDDGVKRRVSALIIDRRLLHIGD